MAGNARRGWGLARGSILWKVAWRNLWRHRGRTFIMGSAVAFIYALTLVGLGVNDDGHRRMLDEATRAAGGDILVHGDGYWSSRASDIVVRDAERVLEEVGSVEGVRVAIPRILVNGLLSTSTASSAVFLQGIRPDVESEISDIRDDLVEGRFLEGEVSDPLVLGRELAERLELELGDRVVLTASDPDGELVRALFHLSGILETGSRQLDETVGYTTVDAARSAVGMEGALTQIGVLLTDDADVDAVTVRIRSRLGTEGSGAAGAAGDLEVLPWQEAVPEMVGFIELDEAFGAIYMVVLLVVVLFSIANTFLMAVMERVRELGLLNALGLRGGGIARLLLAETALLTLLSMGLGFALGYGGHLAISHWGISVAAWGLEEMQISGVDLSDLVFYSTLDPVRWGLASALVAGATVASAIYPAWRAARLAPAEAMRFFE
ncbi:MAG: ABC transporter permease [bacterium]